MVFCISINGNLLLLDTWIKNIEVILDSTLSLPAFNLLSTISSTLKLHLKLNPGLPCLLSGKESAGQCRRHGFNSWSGKIPHAAEQLSLCATNIEPVRWSPGAAATEAVQPRAHALQREEPLQWEAREPQLENSLLSPPLEKSPQSSEDPAQSRINK